jgi:integrase
MRKGEILTLKWENIDLANGFILLPKTKNGDRREIPINGTLKALFQSLPRRLDGGYLFYHHKTGEKYDEVKRSFARSCKDAKIMDLHFHDLRHTFASHLVMAGVDLTSVTELLGHKSLAMTMRYAHLAPSHKVKAAEILDSTLNKTPNYTENYTVGSQRAFWCSLTL